MFERIVRGLVDLLAPPRCAACDLPLVQAAPGFCSGCEPLIDEAAPEPDGMDDAACIYGGPLAEAIVHFKYGGRSDLAAPLARLLAQRARVLAGQIDLVCCVPLHSTRLRERGYNQSALLAPPVARLLGARFRPGLLVRVRPTSSQAGLDRAARLRNLRGAFAVHGSVHGRRVLVIDDVATTYSTLSELRRVLEATGALAVRSLVLARTERDQQEC